jgi:hypothetical protein
LFVLLPGESVYEASLSGSSLIASLPPGFEGARLKAAGRGGTLAYTDGERRGDENCRFEPAGPGGYISVWVKARIYSDV